MDVVKYVLSLKVCWLAVLLSNQDDPCPSYGREVL